MFEEFLFLSSYGGETYYPDAIEYWLPLKESPTLSQEEKKSILEKEDVFTSLHPVIPSFLMSGEDSQMGYTPCHELGYFLIVGELRTSPYMDLIYPPLLVLWSEEHKGNSLDKHFSENRFSKRKEFFYLDLFTNPTFGMIRPNFYLFEKAEIQDEVPESMILFKEV